MLLKVLLKCKKAYLYDSANAQHQMELLSLWKANGLGTLDNSKKD